VDVSTYFLDPINAEARRDLRFRPRSVLQNRTIARIMTGTSTGFPGARPLTDIRVARRRPRADAVTNSGQ
jgi:hypothetical protein